VPLVNLRAFFMADLTREMLNDIILSNDFIGKFQGRFSD
jgi:hypothetical protein